MGMFGKKVEEFISNKKKGTCKEGYERTKVGGLWSMCLPKKASPASDETITPSYKEGAKKPPELSGVVTCGDGTKANPALNEYCGDVNGINTKIKRVLKEELPTTPNDYAPAPTLPSGQEEAPTKPSNTQNYILYGVLGVAVITLIMRKNN
jgi:hypothetical protein